MEGLKQMFFLTNNIAELTMHKLPKNFAFFASQLVIFFKFVTGMLKKNGAGGSASVRPDAGAALRDCHGNLRQLRGDFQCLRCGARGG